jgi:hypothetical protein
MTTAILLQSRSLASNFRNGRTSIRIVRQIVVVNRRSSVDQLHKVPEPWIRYQDYGVAN